MPAAIPKEYAVNQRPMTAFREDEIEVTVAVYISDADVRRRLCGDFEREHAIVLRESGVGTDRRGS